MNKMRIVVQVEFKEEQSRTEKDTIYRTIVGIMHTMTQTIEPMVEDFQIDYVPVDV